MSTGLDVWIGKPGCVSNVDDGSWTITVYDAHTQVYQWAGISYANLAAPVGHWAGTIPPGTYVVRAVNTSTGVATDHAIVVVDCGEVACVRLYVRGRRGEEPPRPRNCEVKIDEVFGRGVPDPDAIVVTGTAANCKNVEVTLSCNTRQTSTQVVPVKPDGTWRANMGTENLRCRCGRRVTVVARCVENRECMDRYETEELRCEG